MKKDAVLAQIEAERVIGLLPALSAEALVGCARALAAQGLHSVEVALTTPAVLDTLARAVAELPDFHFGLGTILDVDTARLALESGARFLVTPAPRPDVVTLCRRFNVPIFCGAFSAADVAAAHAAGADAVKIFPGHLFGPAHVRQMRAQFPEVRLIAIGGVTPETLPEFLRAGAFAVVAGSSLLPPAELAAGVWADISQRASAFRLALSAIVPEAA